MGDKKDEALRIISELRGTMEHKPFYDSEESSHFIDMLDDLKDIVQSLDVCQCNSD